MYAIKIFCNCPLWITGFLVVVFSSTEAVAQPVTISGILSSDEVVPNEVFSLVMSLDEPADLYYFEMEVELDPQQVEFISLQNIGLTEGGINIDGETSENRIGVAVSRTDTTEMVDSGEFMELTFRVTPMAEAGTLELAFIDPELFDSDGNLIEIEELSQAGLEIVEGIGVAELIIPEMNQVTEGDSFVVTGRVYASGITFDEKNEGRLNTWAGINSDNTNPENWDESRWQVMEMAGETDRYYHYTGEAAMFRDVGTYSIALRVQLDNREYFYGGVGGFWDQEEHPSAVLEILQAPLFRYNIAVWDFSEGKLTPGLSVPDNDFAEIEIFGASFSSLDPPGTQTVGGITYLNTRNWHIEDSDTEAEKYLMITVSTRQFENLRFSSSHDGTNSSPRNFTVQVSHDADIWENLPGGEIDLSEGVVHLENLSIPEAYNDSETVWIRWLRTGSERLDTTGSDISAQGTHRIGNITITGTNMDPYRIEVLPGDTNNDGVVNSLDVLALGTYWQSEGPKPIYDFISFEPREVEAWIPEYATFADANGDGIVDQKDLLPIGLNFGRSSAVQMNAADIQQEPIVTIGLPPMQVGDEVEVVVKNEQAELIKGLSYKLTIDGVSHDSWTIVKDKMPEWASEWAEKNRLITFSQKQLNAFEKAFIHKGRNRGLEVQEMTVIRIRAEEAWNNVVFLNLEWLALSRPDGMIDQLTSLELLIEGIEPGKVVPETPEITELHQNYPNPFNPATIISYQLSTESRVRLDIFNIIGQHVVTLVESRQKPGNYTLDFDGSDLASGLYLYRLQTEDKVYTRRMMLVK